LLSAILAALFLTCATAPVRAQVEYGAKGIYPVYEAAGQWEIFDKSPQPLKAGEASPLAPGGRFLVIGSRGAELFTVARVAAAYGGACVKSKPLKLRAALLKGPRAAVGTPIIGIKVAADFKLRGSRAKYLTLANEVDDAAYTRLGDPVKEAVVADVKSGAFRFSREDNPSPLLMQGRPTEKVQTKIDFGAKLKVQGLKDAFVFVEESLVSSSSRRCLRLADGPQLAGGCAEMPTALAAETGLLRFVAYDPSGQGNPFILGYTPTAPEWGDERWGFVIRSAGPKLFLSDATDPRCREGF
jgi:hypothetical protein